MFLSAAIPLLPVIGSFPEPAVSTRHPQPCICSALRSCLCLVSAPFPFMHFVMTLLSEHRSGFSTGPPPHPCQNSTSSNHFQTSSQFRNSSLSWFCLIWFDTQWFDLIGLSWIWFWCFNICSRLAQSSQSSCLCTPGTTDVFHHSRILSFTLVMIQVCDKLK